MTDFQELYFASLFNYDYSKRLYAPGNTWNWIKDNRADAVFVMVVGPIQHNLYKVFLEELKRIDGRIIYESELAVNSNYPGTGPRNKVVVWEFKQPDTQPALVVERKAEIPAATTSSTFKVEGTTASPAATTEELSEGMLIMDDIHQEFVTEPGAV